MAGMFPGSQTQQLANSNPIDIVLVDATGAPVFGFDPSRPATGTLTQQTVVATSVVLLPANPARRFVTLYNGQNKLVYIAFAATASATAYTVQIPSGSEYEFDGSQYAGVVSAFGAAGATGKVLVTEVTP